MKTSLRFANAVDIKFNPKFNSTLAIGVGLQLLLFGVCEAVTSTSVRPQETLRLTVLDSQLDPQPTLLSLTKEFEPPDNQKPSGTRGTGTRCIPDSLDNTVQGIFL